MRWSSSTTFPLGKKRDIPARATFYKADIQDRKTMSEIFQKEKPDTLNHHAAQINVRNSLSHPVADAETNIIGSLNLLEAVKDSSVKKVIFASSGGALYDENSILPASENNPVVPLSPYALSKSCFEQYLQNFSRLQKIPFVIFRYSNVYGPRQNSKGEAGVVSIFCHQMLNGEQIVINGDGEQTRDFVFVEDVARANMLVLDDNITNEIINIGTGKETSINRVFAEISDVFPDRDIQKIHLAEIPGEVRRSALSIEKAKDTINWKPEVSFADGIQKTVDYFSSLQRIDFIFVIRIHDFCV
jgi:UDP-glucose 4-epimerase